MPESSRLATCVMVISTRLATLRICLPADLALSSRPSANLLPQVALLTQKLRKMHPQGLQTSLVHKQAALVAMMIWTLTETPAAQMQVQWMRLPKLFEW